MRVVGDDAHRPAFDAGQRRHHAVAPAAAQFQHAAGIGQRGDDGAHVVDPQAVLGHQVAQGAWVGGLPVGGAALEVAQVLLGGDHSRGLVVDQHIHHAIGMQLGCRADLVGAMLGLRELQVAAWTALHGARAAGRL